MGGGAPVVDASGNIWVEAGNGSVYSSSHAYDDSDSVLELSPSLTLLQYFAPSSWAANNANDLDLSTAPALLADGEVVAAGKSRIVYLLNGSSLGGIGGQRSQVGSACGDDIDGGVAVQGTTVYLPCLSGTIAVAATESHDQLRLLWSASVGGGPPIIAAGLVWTIGKDGVLYGLNPSTGVAREQRHDRRVGERLPDPVGGRRPPPGPRRGACGGVLGSFCRGDQHDDGSLDDNHDVPAHHHDDPNRHDDLDTGGPIHQLLGRCRRRGRRVSALAGGLTWVLVRRRRAGGRPRAQ